jgi:hypothetical protein
MRRKKCQTYAEKKKERQRLDVVIQSQKEVGASATAATDWCLRKTLAPGDLEIKGTAQPAAAGARVSVGSRFVVLVRRWPGTPPMNRALLRFRTTWRWQCWICRRPPEWSTVVR